MTFCGLILVRRVLHSRHIWNYHQPSPGINKRELPFSEYFASDSVNQESRAESASRRNHAGVGGLLGTMGSFLAQLLEEAIARIEVLGRAAEAI